MSRATRRGRWPARLAFCLGIAAVVVAGIWFLRAGDEITGIPVHTPAVRQPPKQPAVPPTAAPEPLGSPEASTREELVEPGSWDETVTECFRGIDRSDGSIVLLALLRAGKRMLLEARIQEDSLDFRRHDDGLFRDHQGQRIFTLVDGTGGNSSACVSEYGQGPRPAATSEATVSWATRGWRSPPGEARVRELPYFQVRASFGGDPENLVLVAGFELECTVEEEPGAPPTKLRYSAAFTDGKGTEALEQRVAGGPRTTAGGRALGVAGPRDGEIAAAARELLEAVDERLRRMLAGVPRQ